MFLRRVWEGYVGSIGEKEDDVCKLYPRIKASKRDEESGRGRRGSRYKREVAGVNSWLANIVAERGWEKPGAVDVGDAWEIARAQGKSTIASRRTREEGHIRSANRLAGGSPGSTRVNHEPAVKEGEFLEPLTKKRNKGRFGNYVKETLGTTVARRRTIKLRSLARGGGN